MKVRFFPSPIQKTFIQKALGASRKLYNEAVECINKEYEAQKDIAKRKYSSFFDLRKKVVISNADATTPETKWLTEVPFDTRQLAVRAAVNARKTCISQMKSKLIKHFKLSFKSRKDVNKIAYFDASSLSLSKKGELQLCKTGFLSAQSVLQLSRRGKQDVVHYFKGERSDYSIVLEGDAYYLCLSTTSPREARAVYEGENDCVVAIDPGIRTFMTGYSPSGVLIKTSDTVETFLKTQFTRVDGLASSMTGSKGRRLKRMRQRKLKVFKKIKDVVNDMHINVANTIANSYDTILLPEFGTSKMLSEAKLHSSTKRMMGALSFYRFKERLKRECQKAGTRLIICTEEFTSKTCTSCGRINEKLGGNKTFTCERCNLCIERDVNGARNILLKYL